MHVSQLLGAASRIAAWLPVRQLLIREDADALAGRPDQLLLGAACCWALRLPFPLAPWLPALGSHAYSLDHGSPPTCSTNSVEMPFASGWQEGAHGLGIASAAAISCSCTTTSLFAAASAAGAAVFAPLRGVLHKDCKRCQMMAGHLVMAVQPTSILNMSLPLSGLSHHCSLFLHRRNDGSCCAICPRAPAGRPAWRLVQNEAAHNI